MGFGGIDIHGDASCQTCCETSMRPVSSCCLTSTSNLCCFSQSASCCNGTSSGCCVSTSSCNCNSNSQYLVDTPDSYFYVNSQYGEFRLALNAVHGFQAFTGANAQSGTNGTSRFFTENYYVGTIKVQTSSTSTESGYNFNGTKYYLLNSGSYWIPDVEITQSGSYRYSARTTWMIPSSDYLGQAKVSGRLSFFTASDYEGAYMEFVDQVPGTVIFTSPASYVGAYNTVVDGYAKLVVMNYGAWYTDNGGIWAAYA